MNIKTLKTQIDEAREREENREARRLHHAAEQFGELVRSMFSAELLLVLNPTYHAQAARPKQSANFTIGDATFQLINEDGFWELIRNGSGYGTFDASLDVAVEINTDRLLVALGGLLDPPDDLPF